MFFTKCIHSFLIFLIVIMYCNSDCVTSVNEFKNILVLTNNNEILYSNDGKGNIVTKNGNTITLACPGSKIKYTDDNYAQFTCTNKDYTYKKKQYHNTNDLTCATTLKPEEKQVGTCFKNNLLISIGFQVQNQFLEHIQVCWDNVKKAPLYTYAILKKYLGECQVQSERPQFRTGDFFNTPQYYTQKSQEDTLKKMFNTIPRQIDKKNLLEIGHLVAKCDFVYDIQQKLTFQFINAAPQWKSVNGGNWKLLESKIRSFVRNQKTELEMYSGTYSVLKINNKNYYLNYNNQQIPVPQYFWKVVIKKEGSSNLGLAIIGSNDIFEALNNPCTDIINTVQWLKIDKNKSVRSGYMIACNVNEFKKINGLKDQLPDFPSITGILR